MLGNKKVAVVGHSMFFKVYTTHESYWHDPKNLNTFAGPDQSHTLMNCEFYPDLSVACDPVERPKVKNIFAHNVAELGVSV